MIDNVNDKWRFWRRSITEDLLHPKGAYMDLFEIKEVDIRAIPSKDEIIKNIEAQWFTDEIIERMESCLKLELKYDDYSWGISETKTYKYRSVDPLNFRIDDYIDSAKHAFAFIIESKYKEKDEIVKTSLERIRRDMLKKNNDAIKEEKDMQSNQLNQLFKKKFTIKDIQVYNDRVVKMEFGDGTFTKAICGEHDEFNFDTGITICVLKHLMGGQKEGTKRYNDFIRNAYAMMNRKEEKKQRIAEEQENQKQKKRKAELKKAAKKIRAMNDQIDIQKTAFAQALRECGLAKEDDLK